MIQAFRARSTLKNLVGRLRGLNMSALQKVQQAAQQSKVHTVEELKRWSVGDQELPSMLSLQQAFVAGGQ